MIRDCEGYCFVLDSYSDCLKSCLAALLGRINPGLQFSLSVCSLFWGLVRSIQCNDASAVGLKAIQTFLAPMKH